MKRTLRFAVFVFVLVAALCETRSPARAADRAQRPNVVLIMADDMGYECVGANGGNSYHTPRLDALAAGGMRFEHAHSQPLCTPSRVQIMTGIYNNRNYIRFGILDREARTFGNMFQAAGYKTCIVGKWQLEGGFDAPRRFGFDEYCLWQLTRRPARYANPGLEINGKEVDYDGGEYGPDIVSDYLCDFVRRNKQEPFFVWYPMILPHFPFVPTPDSTDYDRSVRGEKGTGKAKYFADMVAYTDKIVGKVIDMLEAEGLRENTLVIFTGDNGTHPKVTSKLNGEPYPGGKGSTTDNGTHVPLIANWPGRIPPATVNGNLVDFSDILPTIADVAGLEVPQSWHIDGLSFAKQLRGDTTPTREWIYCWYHRNGLRDEASQHVRTQRFKLYAGDRFFDVRRDFQEKQPLDLNGLSTEQKAAYDLLRPVLLEKLRQTEECDPVQERKREAS